jgi:hypothetical protein
VTAPTYYPGAAAIEGAQVLTLRDNERRESVDIRMARSPNLCIEGELPAGARFEIQPRRPVVPFNASAPRSGAVVPEGTAGPDGTIRVCDLPAGEFEFSVHLPPLTGDVPDFFAATLVSITDRDVSGIALTPAPKLVIPGEIVWDGAAPAPPAGRRMSVVAFPLAQRFGRQQLASRVQFTSAVPGTFEAAALIDDYRLEAGRPPDGAYVTDITYGGRSVLHAPFRPGSATGEGGLRVILGLDGGTITANVTDRDGNPVPDVRVVAIPKTANSEAALAAMMTTGQADSSGSWTSPLLAPGGYYLVATTAPVDDSPESIARLWRARGQAEEVELAPSGRPRVTVPVTGLE